MSSRHIASKLRGPFLWNGGGCGMRPGRLIDFCVRLRGRGLNRIEVLDSGVDLHGPGGGKTPPNGVCFGMVILARRG